MFVIKLRAVQHEGTGISPIKGCIVVQLCVIWKPTCNTHVHVSTTCPQEREAGEGNSFSASLMMYLAPRTVEISRGTVIQTLPTFSHMISYPQVTTQSRNNSMPPVPGKLGKKPLTAHSIHHIAYASVRPLQQFPNVYSKVVCIHPSRIRQVNVPGTYDIKKTRQKCSEGGKAITPYLIQNKQYPESGEREICQNW